MSDITNTWWSDYRVGHSYVSALVSTLSGEVCRLDLIQTSNKEKIFYGSFRTCLVRVKILG